MVIVPLSGYRIRVSSFSVVLFSAAVVSDQTHRLATLYREGNVPQHLAVFIAPALSEQQPLFETLPLVQKRP